MKLYEVSIINIVHFTITAAIAGCCFDYVLLNVFGKDIPWYGDVVAGFFAGVITVPGAVVIWVLKLCGVAMPLIA